MKTFIDWVMESPQTRFPLVTALIGVLGAIIGGFFTVIVWQRLNAAFGNLYDKTTTWLLGRDFEYRYLDWVINQHQYLPILPTTLTPVTDMHFQELDTLYVSLTMTEDQQRTREISLGDALRNTPALVILGDPGAGKTTILRFLALTLARARRKRVPRTVRANHAQVQCRIQDARKRVKEEFGYANFPLPIFVYLNRLRDVTAWSGRRSLLDALRDEWQSVDNLRDSPESFFDDKLRRGECIFLFDAFDELGTQEARDAIARHIGSLAASAPQGNRFIVTSRIVGYNGQRA
jgi:hypothetical protein